MDRPASRFNHSIHGARGLFSLLVFFYHVHHSGLTTYPLFRQGLPYEAFDVGKYGVELFFGISGIVIVGTLARTRDLRDFLVNRFTRIMPALWASILVITVLTVVAHRPMPGPGEYLLNFLSPPPFIELPLLNPAAWSLQYELFFYVIAAACWRIGGRRPAAAWGLALVAALLLLFYPRGLMLLSGVAIALGMTNSRIAEVATRFPGVALVGFLAAWRAIELGFGWADPEGGLDIAAVAPQFLPAATWLLAFALMAAATLLGTVAMDGLYRERGWLSAFLRLPAMQWLGLVSYSFYIWHPVVMAVVKGLLIQRGVAAAAGDHAQLLFFVLALPPALLVAGLSQRFIETRLTARLRFLLDRRPPPEHAPNVPV
jgi:peptidoglycan/LPS O-acetylase OafA/YrhL